MNVHGWPSLLVVGVICAGCVGCSNGNDVTVQGSGATFPAPIYKRWFLEYYKKHSDVRVNYTPIGSGAGIRQFTNGLVLFGASDAGMSGKEMEALPESFGPKEAGPAGRVKLLPLTAGSIVLSYNLPGVSEPITLSRNAYIDIFLGEITEWNDPKIEKDNPGVKLPGTAVRVVTRADSSGTTDVFTNHLYVAGGGKKEKGEEVVKGRWPAEKVGKAPKWKDGMIAGQGNDGVAALIQMTPGAIGYLELGYAKLARLPMARLKNKVGMPVAAKEESGLAALEAGLKALEKAKKPLPPDLQIKNYDPDGDESYPIVTYTWVLCRGHYPRSMAPDAHAFKEVVRYCVSDEAQEIAGQLDYIPLPRKVRDAVLKAVDEITIED
jgi:phosphate transport system substrate-binding protein